MHNCLKSIGLAGIKTIKDEKKLLDLILTKPDKKKMTTNSADEDSFHAELTKEFAPGIGMKIIGQFDEYDQFRLDNYYPYSIAPCDRIEEDCLVDRKMESMSFSGLCEDSHFGMPLIFHVVNTLDCILAGEPSGNPKRCGIELSGLATEGSVLLPTINTRALMNEQKPDREMVKSAGQDLMDEDIDPGEYLMEELDRGYKAYGRINNEDVFSIVETTFMPFGMDVELYKIIGIIEKVFYSTNSYSGEEICHLQIICNELRFTICINRASLAGEPKPGRRFRGIIWLQGIVFQA